MCWRGCWSGASRAACRRGPMRNNRRWRRWLADHAATLMAGSAAVLVLVPLIAILTYLVWRGAGAINLSFLTQSPKPVGETGGGFGNAIAGSALILAIASGIGVPIGI